jgi:adenylate cyclase
LGVAFVVEGSVRKSEDTFRINAQLIETTTGTHIWAERYDRSQEDIFAVQDEVVEQIVEALRVVLTPDDIQRLETRYTSDLEAFDHVLRGWWYYGQFSPESNIQARLMFSNALEADPTYADAMTGMGFTYYEEWAQVWTLDKGVLERARDLAMESLNLDEAQKNAHTLLGHVYSWTDQHELAIAEQERAVELAPNDSRALRDLGEALLFAGRTQEGIEFIKRGMALDPHYGVAFPLVLGMAYSVQERYDEALTVFEEALRLNPNTVHALIALAGCHVGLGNLEEAQQYVIRAKALNPQISIDLLKSRLPFKNPSTTTQLLEGARMAGLE